MCEISWLSADRNLLQVRSSCVHLRCDQNDAKSDTTDLHFERGRNLEGNMSTFKAFAAAIIAIVASFWLPMSAARAQVDYTQPAYYSVVGVAQNDVLNVRQTASGSSQIVGALQPNTGPIEVLFEEGNWGYVISNESNGYVSMNFLQPIMVQRVGQSDLPQSASCMGTEPFWDLSFSNGGVTLTDYAMAEPTDEAFSLIEGGLVGNTGAYKSFLRAESTSQTMVASITNRQCSDGMSDRDHAREITVLMFGEGETRSLSGCCSVFPASQ